VNSASSSPIGALRWAWLSLAVILMDQATKWMIVTRLQLFERHAVFPVLDITRLHNRGAAFSFLNDAGGWQFYLFVGLALLVSVGILVWLSRLAATGVNFLTVGLSLILGGALGNALDRVSRGYVVDFIHVHWREVWYFPAFNVADSAITVGAVCLLLDALLDSLRSKASGGQRP
jgi:signal peptidase II